MSTQKGINQYCQNVYFLKKKKEKKRIDESVNFRIFQFHPLIKRGLKTKICYERKLKRISNFQKTKLFKLLQKAFI